MLRTIFLLVCVWLGSHGLPRQGRSDCNCGEANRERQDNRIFNGDATEENEYPWMVRIESYFPEVPFWNLCGGSLISDRFIVTAAHCVSRRWDYGDANPIIVKLNWGTRNAMNLNIYKYVVHEQYNTYDKSLFNDIALLELEDPIDFSENPHLRPICLPSNSREDYTGYYATVAGWGKTGHNAPSSDVLLQANVIASQCPYPEYSGESNICARTTDSNPQGNCGGDSGGPLMTTPYGKNSYTLIGVVSFTEGNKDCMTQSKPGGFVRITHFLDWIKEKTRGSNTCGPKTG